MKGRSLISIFSTDHTLDYSAVEWQQNINAAFNEEFYRREVDTLMRQDLKTDEQWRLHALSLSKGEAHVYSYNVSHDGGSGQNVDPQLHPYTGCLSANKKGNEIPLTIYGLLPETGTLGAHIYVEFKDIYNKMEKNVVFFGTDLKSINYQAAVWCEEYFTKCQQGIYSLPSIVMEEVFWNPYSHKTYVLNAATSKKTTGMSSYLLLHFQDRLDSVPQDANPCVTFVFQRDSTGEIEKSSFQVRITHIKI